MLPAMLFRLPLPAQTVSNIDSVRALLNAAAHDTSRATQLNALSSAFWDAAQYDSALKRATEAKELASRIISANDVHSKSVPVLKNLGGAFYRMAISHWAMGESDRALEYDSAAIKIFRDIGDKKAVGEVYNMMGVIYKDKGDFEDALKHHRKALEIRIAIGDTLGTGYSYKNIGAVYFEQDKLEDALTNYYLAVKHEESVGDKRGVANSYMNIGNIFFQLEKSDDALSNYKEALNRFREIGDKKGISNASNNIGNVYGQLGNYPEALEYFKAALKLKQEIGDKKGAANSLLNIGIVYDEQGNYREALSYYLDALRQWEELKSKTGIVMTLNSIGIMFENKGQYAEATAYLTKALEHAKEIGDLGSMEESLLHLSTCYSKTGDYRNAFELHKQYAEIKDSILNISSMQQINDLKTRYETERKEKEIELLSKDRLLSQANVEKQKNIRNSFAAGLSLVLVFSIVLAGRYRKIRQQKKIIEREKARSDELLNNILPEEVAEELKENGIARAKHFDDVTVMFTDFKDFTQISERLSPEDLVAEIDTCFKAFDNIITKHKIEKIKTIGDSYMCAGGLPVMNKTNAGDVVAAALEIQQYMKDRFNQMNEGSKTPFEVRIGIHTGPVVAGIVGIKKFAYDIWGDTVNIASRMESHGEAGKVNISGATYEKVKDVFHCEHRGKIQAKSKGETDMYFVNP